MAYEGILHPYQRRYLNDKSRFKAGLFSRQTGKTFTTTLEAVDDCLDAESEGRISKWTILSASRDRAKDAIDDGVKRHLQAYQTAFEYLEIEPPPGTDIEETVYEVRFPGGSRIRAVAATPNTARGISENVILDEFAWQKNNRQIWIAVFPVVSRGDLKLRVISTTNGKGEKFYEIMTSPEMAKVFSRHVVDIYQAVADGLPRNIEELKSGLNDPDAWAQEYECQFMDAAGSWLTYDLIDGCEHDDAGIPELYTGGFSYVGMDFGRRKNLTSIYAFEEVDDVLWLREWVELEKTRFAIQMDELARMFKTYKVIRAGLDQTGMGEKPVEDAEEAHGKEHIEGFLFSATVKLNMATILKTRMEDRRLRIPRRTELRTDLHSVTKTVGPGGHPRLAAPTLNGSHADRFWACALGCAVADTEAPPNLADIQTTGQLNSHYHPQASHWGSIPGVNHAGY